MPIFPVEALKSLITALEGLIEDLEEKLDAWPAERGTDNAELETDAETRYTTLAAYVDGIEGLLEHATYGLEALKDLLVIVQADLDNPNQYKANVSGLALQATLLTVAGYLDTEIAAIIAAIVVVQADLDNPNQYKADVSALATAAKLEDAMQKATGPAYNQDTDSLEAIREAIDAISVTVLAPAYGDIKVYPWAADAVLDADPDYTYTAEVSEAGTSYVEVGHFDFNEDTADIKGIFVNLVWGQKITGAGSGKVKWQMASGSNASPGAYADITDEVSETLTDYSDHGRSGVVHEITGVPLQMPFTIRCVVKNVDATSAEAKIKSNSYIRAAYKRVS